MAPRTFGIPIPLLESQLCQRLGRVRLLQSSRCTLLLYLLNSCQLKSVSPLQVSWGTKGCDKLEMVTPIRSALPQDLRELDISTKKVRQELNQVTVVEDNCKAFRTGVLIFWLFSNVVLALAVENYGGWLDLGDPSLTREAIQLFHAKQTEGRQSYISALLSVTYMLVFVRCSGVRFTFNIHYAMLTLVLSSL